MSHRRTLAPLAATALALLACNGPVFTRFELLPPQAACPGDTVTVGWSASNAVNVTLDAPGVDPRYPNPTTGAVTLRIVGDTTVTGHAVGYAGSVAAAVTARVFTGSRTIRLDNNTSCRDGALVQVSTLTPIADLPASLVVAQVTAPVDRDGTIAHAGMVVPFRAGQGAVTGFEGQSLWGEWVVSQQLRAGEACGMGTTAGAPAPTAQPALASARCPDLPAGTTPGVVTDTCGHMRQACCPTTTQCASDLTCYAGQCIAGSTTCSGAPTTPATREWPFEVLDASRCATGTTTSAIADSEDEARGCLAARGLAVVSASELHHHRWLNRAVSCTFGGEFYATDADRDQCARARCSCDAPLIDTPCPP